MLILIGSIISVIIVIAIIVALIGGITGNGEMFQENQSPLEDEVLKMFRELSDNTQRIIRDYVKMVLEQQEALQSLQEGPEKGPHPIHDRERA